MFRTHSGRSPLKAKPLRVAGQSLDRQISDFFDDNLVGPFLVCVLLWLMAGLEWYRYLVPTRPIPEFYTAIALGTTCYVAWRFIGLFRRLRAMKLGRDGERAVAELLERMRERGFRVFHDIVAPNFNVDHLLIGPQGLFAIETKTITKPGTGKPLVEYDGESVIVGGFKPDRDPVGQATAISRWIRDLLNQSTGRDYDVKPVVLYPGWYVENRASKKPLVWVLEPKALPKFIEHEPVRLSSEDVNLVAFHLSRYIRTNESSGSS